MTQRFIAGLSLALFIVALLWGGYTLIVYMGIPLHSLVYIQVDAGKAVDTACGNGTDIGTALCRGPMLFMPFLSSFLAMMSPLFGYIIVSVLLYGGFFVYLGFSSGTFSGRITLRPLYFIVAFVLAVWLIGTTLSLGSLNNMNTPGQDTSDPIRQFRTVIEPTKEVYTSASEQALIELKSNFQMLQSAGCLQPYVVNGEAAQTNGGAKVYTLSELCVQSSLLLRVGGQIAMILFLLFNLLVAGTLVLRYLVRLEPVSPLLESVLSVSVGALVWVAVLWLLALVGQLTQPIVWALFIGLPIVAFPVSWRWLRSLWTHAFEVDVRAGDVLHLLVWLLLSYLALNFLNVVRPFPIGWDDLGSYLNRPRMLASYGSFIPSMSQFQWEYLTSMGYVLFGFNSIFGSTFAMQINWMAGLLAAFSVFAFGRHFLGQRAGVLAAICYYFLPMTGHFSFADMKIDNAVFFTSTIGLLAVMVGLFGTPEAQEQESHDPKKHLRLFLVAGLIMGFSFAIKPTALLSVLMIFSIMSGWFFGAVGFSGAALLGFAVLNKFGPLDLSAIIHRAGLIASVSQQAALVPLTILGVGLLTFAAYRTRRFARSYAITIGFFLLGLAISCAPWMAYNGIIAQNKSLSSLLKAEDRTAPQIFLDPVQAQGAKKNTLGVVRTLPPELKLDPENAACKSSARTEELDRYWGFDNGIGHYLSLPWRQVMNIDAYGYYVTLMPALLLFPLLLLLPYFWVTQARWLRFLFAGACVFLIQWMLVANGVMWYGLGMFLMFALGLEAFILRAPDKLNRILFSVLLTFGILICLINRLWQFDTQKNIFEYPLGKVSATALREMTIPDYDNITQSVLDRAKQMPDRPYTYRMGTFISYFIPKNREILPVADHQLQMFNCMDQERNHALTLKRLQALGFNGMIFDTNTATIEKDPNGSLHKKVQAFIDFANDPSTGVKISISDPGNGIAYILLP